MPRKTESAQYEPNPSDRMVDFLPESVELTKNSSFAVSKFLDKIRDIQNSVKSELAYGEMICIINHGFGYKTWREIKWGEMPAVKEYLKENAKNYLKIIAPDFSFKFENYNPMNDSFLLKLEEWCPGVVKDLLAPYKGKINF